MSSHAKSARLTRGYLTALGISQFQPRLNTSSSYFQQLLSLDSTGTEGIAGEDFIHLFCQCSRCLLLVARGAVERHECPESWEALHLACSPNPLTWMARLESLEGEGSGISVGVFQHLFVQCKTCLGYVTTRKINSHSCTLEG